MSNGRQSEFDTIVVLILAQLYEAFPKETEIEQSVIAEKMGVPVTPNTIDPQYRDVYGAHAGGLLRCPR
jgi:hypothetical protein